MDLNHGKLNNTNKQEFGRQWGSGELNYGVFARLKGEALQDQGRSILNKIVLLVSKLYKWGADHLKLLGYTPTRSLIIGNKLQSTFSKSADLGYHHCFKQYFVHVLVQKLILQRLQTNYKCTLTWLLTSWVRSVYGDHMLTLCHVSFRPKSKDAQIDSLLSLNCPWSMTACAYGLRSHPGPPVLCPLLPPRGTRLSQTAWMRKNLRDLILAGPNKLLKLV